jgi:hypothetical protein
MPRRPGTGRRETWLLFLMDYPSNDDLLSRADSAMMEARHLRAELSQKIATGHAIRRRFQQQKTIMSGLDPAVAISQLVRAHIEDR